MKKSKNMYVKETHESRELYLYLLNNSNLWTWILDIKDLLKKYVELGIYEHEIAVEQYYRVATQGAKIYQHIYGSEEDFSFIFDVTSRWTAADSLATYIENQYYKDII